MLRLGREFTEEISCKCDYLCSNSWSLCKVRLRKSSCNQSQCFPGKMGGHISHFSVGAMRGPLFREVSFGSWFQRVSVHHGGEAWQQA